MKYQLKIKEVIANKLEVALLGDFDTFAEAKAEADIIRAESPSLRVSIVEADCLSHIFSI